MKKIIYLFLFVILCINCTKENSLIDTTCKIQEYYPFVEIPVPLYNYKVLYSDDKIIKRIRNGNIAPSTSGVSVWGEISRDSIVFDEQGRVWKIYKMPKTPHNWYSEFLYINSDALPDKRNELHFYNDAYTHTVPEDIFYDIQNRIIKTVVDYNKPGYEFDETTIYFYENGNLSKIEITGSKYGINYSEVRVYADYDKKKNPFINMPFIDFRGISSSKNNYRHTESSHYSNGLLSGSSSSSFSLNYNEYGYPLIGTYECN